jgi:hypothetical protein
MKLPEKLNFPAAPPEGPRMLLGLLEKAIKVKAFLIQRKALL